MSELVTIGETMALLLAPEVGRLRDMTALRLSIAGAESNVAIGYCRLGHTATWIGRVGDDEPGALILKTLRAEHVEPAVVLDPTAPTALMLKELRLPNITRVTYYRSDSAGSRLNPDDLDPAVIVGARILHITGITAALSISARRALFCACEIARAADVIISFDVNYRSRLWSPAEATPVLRDLATRADIVFAGEDELELLSGGRGSFGAQNLAGSRSAEIVVKRGALGSFALIGETVVEHPAFAVAAVDSVGAGDAFVAGYLAAREEGVSPIERLRHGSLCGAFAVTSRGDWETLPSRADLELLGIDEGTTLR